MKIFVEKKLLKSDTNTVPPLLLMYLFNLNRKQLPWEWDALGHLIMPRAKPSPEGGRNTVWWSSGNAVWRGEVLNVIFYTTGHTPPLCTTSEHKVTEVTALWKWPPCGTKRVFTVHWLKRGLMETRVLDFTLTLLEHTGQVVIIVDSPLLKFSSNEKVKKKKTLPVIFYWLLLSLSYVSAGVPLPAPSRGNHSITPHWLHF